MTYGHITSPVMGRLPYRRPPKRRRSQPIPGMCTEKRAIKFTDEQVIQAILDHLGGKTQREIADDLGASRETVGAWCQGTIRRLCQMEAERRWEQLLAKRAK